MTQRDYAELLKRPRGGARGLRQGGRPLRRVRHARRLRRGAEGPRLDRQHHHERRGVLLGCPAITLPLLSDENLPLGLQLMGGVDRDAALFDAAAWVLAALNRSDLIGSLET